jgi:hypothetical protein
MRRLLFVLAAPIFAGGAFAAESLTELATGALDFVSVSDPAAFVLQSEDIYVSPKIVRVHYEIQNAGANALDIGYAFKFPDLDFFDPDVEYAIPGVDPQNFLGIVVKSNGKPAALKFTQQAWFDNKDVSATLRDAKLAFVPVGSFQNEISTAGPDMRAKLVKLGLIVASGVSADGAPLYFPSWTVRTSAAGRLSIAPLSKASLELAYMTSLGSSPDSVLRKAVRSQQGAGALVAQRNKDYCVDSSFLGGLDKIAGADEANQARVREKRIQISASSGAFAPPALDYRLVVDKGNALSLVSFCSENLKKIGATQFEYRAKNVAQNAALKFLVIEKGAP